jgi:enamine deaminase RidA (YjgF/YER057c/UK114 family)
MPRRQLRLVARASTGASPAVGVDVAVGQLVFVSGQIARSPGGAIIGAGDTAHQARACFDQIGELLAEAGGRLQDVTRLVYYLTDIDADLGIVCAVRDTYAWDPAPASTAVQVAGLAHPDLRVEIEATAVVSRRGAPASGAWPARS